MRDFKTKLDKYLTTEPYNNYEDYYEDVIERFTQEFYEKNWGWIEEWKCGEWLNKLYVRGDTDTLQAARIIERAFKFYKL